MSSLACRQVSKSPEVMYIAVINRGIAMAENTKASSPERIQVNVRVDGDLIKTLDEKRIELLKELGSIPSRSEVIRMALEDYLTNNK